MKMAQKLPLNYTYPSQVKQKLMRAHAELLEKHYLTQVLYRLTQQGEEKVIYEWLLLDSRVMEVPRSSNLIVVPLSSSNPLFFNGLKKAAHFSGNVGA